MYAQHAQEIQTLIQTYFHGIFYGDIPQLRSAFHPQALLFGEINEQAYLKNLDDYLDGVQQRKSPSERGETFRMKVISIEILGLIAIAKLHCPMLDFNYYDYLSLSQIDGKWLILNKTFTHVAA